MINLILMSLCMRMGLLCIKISHREESSKNEQNENFLLKKYKGAIEYKRHCFSASNIYTLVQKREWCISTNDGVIHEFLGANGM